MRNPKKPRKTNRPTIDHAVRTLDNLAQFEEFAANILPRIQRDLARGLSAQEILKKYAPFAAARTVTVALMDEDSSKAIAASKQVVEQAEGKPVEKKEIRHQFEDLIDEELDALVISKLRAINDEE